MKRQLLLVRRWRRNKTIVEKTSTTVTYLQPAEIYGPIFTKFVKLQRYYRSGMGDFVPNDYYLNEICCFCKMLFPPLFGYQVVSFFCFAKAVF